VPEIRYLLARLLLRSPTRPAFITAWSLWRRTHQADAENRHYRRKDKVMAVGTPITERPPQSGRIEARTGLRMMPTSPRSPLSFRTAGFPQYGWKAGLSGGAFPDRQRLKPAPGMRLLSAGLPSPFVHHSVEAVVPY
jgi:hypothetical protein